MAPTVVATAKDPAANSYCDEDFAEEYFDGRLNAGAWSADPALQPTALVMATMRLEQEKYTGTRTTQEQALKWPRIGAYDDDGVAVDPDEVPVDVQKATCEMALVLLVAGTSDPTAATGLEQFKSLSVSSIKLEMRDAIAAIDRQQLPPNVQRLLRPFLVTDVPKENTWNAVRLTRT